MLVAADYPFLDVLWTMLIFFIWIAWFMLLFRVIIDLFRRHDISGVMKVVWMIFVIVVPFLGVFVYLITQSRNMAERDMKEAQASKEQFDSYVKTVSGGGAATEIEKANALLSSGAITQAEFDAIKQKALAS